MTAATHTLAPPRSGPAIRALLTEWAADEVPQFENEFHQALSEAAHSYDIAPSMTCSNGGAALRQSAPTP